MRIIRIAVIFLLGILLLSAFACDGDGGPTPASWGTHTWTFYAAGFFPKHLPNSYTGDVVTADLDPANVPDEVQGIWWYDSASLEYRFWVPGVGGDLTTMTGQFYNYMVLVTGACEWEIPLP